RVHFRERHRWHADEQAATLPSFAQDGAGEERGRLIAHHDLAGDGRGFHLHGLRCRWTRDHQLTVDVAEDEEVEVTSVNADVHLQRRGTAGRLDAPDVAEL